MYIILIINFYKVKKVFPLYFCTFYISFEALLSYILFLHDGGEEKGIKKINK